MAGTAVTIRQEFMDGTQVEHLRLVSNRTVADLETIRANTDLISRNRCFGKAATAQGTTTSKVKSVNSVDFAIDGAIFRKAGTDDLWTLSGSVVAISSWQKYLLCLDSAGAASIVAGTASTVSAAAVTLPTLPTSKAVIGVLTIATNGSTTFTPGTTALNAAGITATFADGLDSGYFSAGASALTAYLVNTYDG
jgi:hypothetical protein